MTERYAGRELVKRGGGIAGTDADVLLDELIEQASERVREQTGNRFIPYRQTRYFDWPQAGVAFRPGTLLLDAPLRSVTSLKTRNGATTIDAADYFLWPYDGPPYWRIDLDRAASTAFEAAETSQRAIEVAGEWGLGGETVPAGTVASGLAASASATTCTVSNSALVDVGDTLVAESEAIFVAGRALADTTANLAADVAANKSATSIPVNTGSLVQAGETVTIDAERMLVESVSGNTLTVVRAWDGSTLAAHSTGADVYAPRLLTVERGVQGTTAATHANGTAIEAYRAPAQVRGLVIAEVLAGYQQQRARFGRTVGPDGATTVINRREIADLWEAVTSRYTLRNAWVGV